MTLLQTVSSSKDSPPYHSPNRNFSTARCSFDHLHIDIFGPLPPTQGFRYLLAIIDRSTHWPEAIPLPDITAESVARALVTRWQGRSVRGGGCGGMSHPPQLAETSSVDLHPVTFVDRELACVDMT